mgnify:FL=1
MNQAVTGQTGSGMIDSEEEMMDGAGSSGADSGNVSYKAADLLKTVKNLQKVSENNQQTAALDRQYLSSGRRYRCYEYYACIRYGTYP